MRYLLFALFGLYVFSLNAQQYEVETFYDEYDDLIDYKSVLLQTIGSTTWEKRFDLNFGFPYYDNTYDHINCFYEGVCNFDGDNGYLHHALASLVMRQTNLGTRNHHV